MDQRGPEGFWTNTVVQRPVMETYGAQVVTPALRPRQSDSSLDGRKTGATLMFTGVFLTLMGVTFTTMGWQHYKVDPKFEWIQLLGPILISVGGTFVFTSVCKFGIISCCRQREEEVMEQTLTGHSFTLSNIPQPIMLHGPATMLCIPPAYNFITQDVRQAVEFQPGASVSGVHADVPPYDAVCCVDNAAFTAGEEERSAHSAETQHRGSRVEESGSTCSRPPAYEDIYPSFNKHNPT